MKTKGDCLALYLNYLDEATKKGVDLPTTKNADWFTVLTKCGII